MTLPVTRLVLVSALILYAGQAHAQKYAIEDEALIEERMVSLQADEAPLSDSRGSLIECEEGCVTPTEAVEMAFMAGAGRSLPGRFLLKVRGGGQSLGGNLGRLYFVSSQQRYAEFGTLTVAFEDHVLNALLQRAQSCGGGLVDGRISVQGCRQDGLSNVNMFTMMSRLSQRRIVVEGDVQLQWIDSRYGTPRPTSNQRGEHERGYFQPWVWVYDANQITFVYDDE